jgi:hypothetical protein
MSFHFLLTALALIAKSFLVFLLLLLARLVLWLAHMFLIALPLDPLKNLPGPSGSLLQNHFREIME